jgi:hypothetical protein
MKLIEFLIARITEDKIRERRARLDELLGDMPPESHDSASAAFEDLYSTQIMDVQSAVVLVAWSIVGGLGKCFIRGRAARYADHPDFRDEWRVMGE